jgi:hypothetical protein
MKYKYSAVRTRISILLGIILLINLNALGQVSGIITGPNGKPLNQAEVFINRTSLRSVTDEFGQFALSDVPPGLHELVAYKEGYPIYRAPMRVQDGRNYSLNLKLNAPEKKQKGKTTPEDIASFGHAILGDDGLILFHDEKQVQVQHQNGKYRVLSGPVVIEYPNAGYRISGYFNPTVFQDISEAAFHYQEYHGSDVNQNISFEKVRMALFRGSLRHFLMALVAGKASEEGFALKDSQGNNVDGKSIVTPSAVSGYFKIQFNQTVTVNYKEQESKLTSSNPIDANKLGIMINSKVITVSGAMNKPGLAHQLPTDYLPISDDVESTYAEALKYFYEKVYLQTDKPYYYPGEPIWFKAYINYHHPEWRDSLSDVLYIELLAHDSKVIAQRMFSIKEGQCHGDIILPDSLAEGNYYLRGYTMLRRNFGDEGLFTKPIRIVNLLDKMDASQQQPAEPPGGVSISSNKATYKTREKIVLNFSVKDSTGALIPASLSASVTDALQVVAIPEATTIIRNFPISRKEIAKIDELKYRIERGVSFYGQFLNNKGKGEKTQLSFIQWKTGDVLSAETDDDGMFWQTGLQFTDSAQFSYKSDKAKGRPYGKVRILPRDIPPLQTPPDQNLKVITAGAIQRIVSDYEVPKGNRLLDEISVTGKRLDPDEVERKKRRTYGRADHVITSKTLNVGTGNLLYALVGKVPGLMVNPGQGVVYFSRAMGTSITNPVQPLVTVNDVPMFGDAGNILQMIDFNTIESIEFTSRLNSLYGTQGAYGVIAVYTKAGISIDNTDPNFQTIKLPGFSKSRNFLSPVYDDPNVDSSQADYRATIYWNPSIKTDSKTGSSSVTFFAADLPGLYRVVVEGLTADGQPVRGEAYLTIEEKP